MIDLAELFPPTYAAARARFRANLGLVPAMWRGARLEIFCVDAAEDVTIDWIAAEPAHKRKLLVLTTGEHGVEGYVGAAMLQLFIRESLPCLDPTDTGLLLVHAINPWGMKHKRRTNARNVDLNRNFLYNAQPDPRFNPTYARLARVLLPQARVNAWLSPAGFAAEFLFASARLGRDAVRRAALLGQYAFPRGLFYGGDAIQAETQTLMGLYRAGLRAYDQIVHLDMHTGYGPRYQMQLVNSALEPRSSRQCAAQFNYPFVAQATASEFYELRGDMIDYLYAVRCEEFPATQLYATSFEFGTLGDSPWHAFRSLQIKTLENQAYWYGASDAARAQIARDFDELYAPRETAWREKAVADALRAFAGILRAEDFLRKENKR